MDAEIVEIDAKETGIIPRKWKIHLTALNMKLYKRGSKDPEIVIPRNDVISTIKFPMTGIATTANVIVNYKSNKIFLKLPSKQFPAFKDWTLHKSPEKYESNEVNNVTMKDDQFESADFIRICPECETQFSDADRNCPTCETPILIQGSPAWRAKLQSYFWGGLAGGASLAVVKIIESLLGFQERVLEMVVFGVSAVSVWKIKKSQLMMNRDLAVRKAKPAPGRKSTPTVKTVEVSESVIDDEKIVEELKSRKLPPYKNFSTVSLILVLICGLRFTMAASHIIQGSN